MLISKEENDRFIDDLVKKYNYKKLPDNLSIDVRKFYTYNMPSLDITKELYCISTNELLFLKAERIVIGDYGAYIEAAREETMISNLKIKPGQEWRTQDTKYKIKYLWLCTKKDENVKIYKQTHTVSYADYKPNMFYIDVFSVRN